MAAVIGGIFAIFFEHGVDNDDMSDFIGEEEMASDLGAREQERQDFEEWRESLNTFGINDMYGMIADLPKHTRAKSVSPARPNTAFDAFVMSLVRQIGSALGIPAEVLFLNVRIQLHAVRCSKLGNYLDIGATGGK